MGIKSATLWIYKKLKFIIKFAIFLGGFLLLDQAGGWKLIIYVLLAYLFTMYLEQKDIIEEFIAESLYRRFR